MLLPILILGAQTVRYRRLKSGIERQQIKWAAFGFAVAFILLGIALALADLVSADGMAPLTRAIFYIGVTCIFSLSFALMPLGLLVSLLHYRLWEADKVISRSAGYAIITVIVGLIWAATADVTKLLITSLFGSSHAALGTTVGAVVAVGIFTPTQSAVLAWSKRRFDKSIGRLHQLPDRLEIWRNTEDAPELGMRALAIIAEGVHSDGAALLMLTPRGEELVAALDLADPQTLTAPGAARDRDARFAMSLPLADNDGPIGTLLLGPRSDRNRYSRAECEALDEVVEPLAEALRFVRSRRARDTGIHNMVSSVEERLARLERSATLGTT